ncbi:hypothetical protein [Streptomyces sp. NPDC059651]|uniref:hypothetical protein n=1 Tax=Streptomyces sp. NPDC059651 TaxID=3346897 RepID=UPI0036A1B1FD
MKDGRPWVGDQVYDEDADREGIVSDVQGGSVYILRSVYGHDQWQNLNGDRLKITVSLQDRVRF